MFCCVIREKSIGRISTLTSRLTDRVRLRRTMTREEVEEEEENATVTKRSR